MVPRTFLEANIFVLSFFKIFQIGDCNFLFEVVFFPSPAGTDFLVPSTAPLTGTFTLSPSSN